MSLPGPTPSGSVTANLPAKAGMTTYSEDLLRFLAETLSSGSTTPAKMIVCDSSGTAIDGKTIDSVRRLCIDTEISEIVLAAGQVVVNVQDKEEVANNESTTPLAGNGTFVGTWLDCSRYSRITGACFAGHSVNKNANGTLVIEQSNDGVLVDKGSAIAVADAYDPTNPNAYTDAQGVFHENGVAFTVELTCKYVRLNYINGANAQDKFRLSAWKRSLA